MTKILRMHDSSTFVRTDTKTKDFAKHRPTKKNIKKK